MGFWNTFFFPYKGYILLAVTLPYVGWVFSLDVSAWIQWTLWLFNPYTIYGIVVLWVKREELVGLYHMMVGYWRARRLYKEDPDEYMRVMTEDEEPEE